MDLDWIVDNLNDAGTENDIERQGIPNPSLIARKVSKRKLIRLAKTKAASEAISGGLPNIGESFHVIAGGVYDYWNLFPASIKMLDGVDLFYADKFAESKR